MKVIGLDHRMRGLTGSHLVTMVGRFLWVTGPESAVDLNMTIIGTATGIEIFVTRGTARTGTTTDRAARPGSNVAAPHLLGSGVSFTQASSARILSTEE